MARSVTVSVASGVSRQNTLSAAGAPVIRAEVPASLSSFSTLTLPVASIATIAGTRAPPRSTDSAT